jgi:RNA polymerase sigma-70 factor (ECF subfamily)
MVEGLSIQETADLLEIRPETVKTRVHRARTRLRAELESHVSPAIRDAYAFDGERCARLTERVLAGLAHRSRE